MDALAFKESTNKSTFKSLNINPINLHDCKCIYCGFKIVFKKIPDLWEHTPEDYQREYYNSIDIDWMHKEAGVPLKDLILEDGIPGNDVYCHALVCTSAVLSNLDLNDLSTPITEIRKYLSAKYDSRFTMHPKNYENVVSSVLKDIGYFPISTGYSSDGGIDIILSNSNNKQVGIQVKRWKSKIKVEQIRSLLGALIVNNLSKGVFITTSDYQVGAKKLTSELSHKYSIELLNADDFYAALKLSQRKSISSEYPLDYLDLIPDLHTITSLHLNSL